MPKKYPASRPMRALRAIAAVGAAGVVATTLAVSGASAAGAVTSLTPAGSVGAPAGSKAVVYGDQTITKAGTVIDGKDIHGRVIVKAENVTIKNSIIRGTDAGGKYGLVDAMSGKAGLKIYDTTITATKPNYTVNGIMGWNFELHRVNIHNTVDQVHIAGSNVVVKDSWLHGTVHYTNDPYHSDGSHDDNIQIVAGSNISITGNTMTDAVNAALMVNTDRGPVSNLTVANNKLDNGKCISHVTSSGSVTGMKVTNNVFGRNASIKNCAVYSTKASVAMSGNTWTDGTAAVLRTR
ncbi:hypothetical protein [Naasia sp. SYSU D00057]|uniref:hypothetical protein n=1 Tax=Naasia sp. SYSU D00057 TaxID=2817380 RepID=UPI001B3126A3|nr:hypothetical protein [Naasia sp. SYSU D00057]